MEIKFNKIVTPTINVEGIDLCGCEACKDDNKNLEVKLDIWAEVAPEDVIDMLKKIKEIDESWYDGKKKWELTLKEIGT